jgi:hypothetical protein
MIFFKWEEIIGVPMADTPEQKLAIATAFGLRYVNGIDLRALETSEKNSTF